MANRKTKKHGLFWWLFISWWIWIPYLFMKAIQSIAKAAKKQLKAQKAVADQARELKAISWPKQIGIEDLRIPETIGYAEKRYEYPDVSAHITDPFLPAGAALRVNDDCELTHDGKPVGSIGQGKIAEMAADWQRRRDPYQIHLVRLYEDGTALLHIAFYRIPKYSDGRVCSLTGGKGKDAQETLDCLTSGTEVFLDIPDEDGGKIGVYFCGTEIGSLGKKDAEWFADEVLHTKKYAAVIDDTYETDSGKFAADIRIMFDAGEVSESDTIKG